MTKPQKCPGLSVVRGRLTFTGCTGLQYDLTTEPALSTFDASKEMRVHPETMLRQVRAGELYPVIYVNQRTILIYRCAITDFYLRNTCGASHLMKKGRAA